MNQDERQKEKQREKIEKLENKRAKMCVRMETLEKKVEVFIQNDFRHFSDRTRGQIDEIKSWIFKGFIVLIASTIISQIILQFFQ